MSVRRTVLFALLFIANGTLPNVAWVVDEDLDDEHPGVGKVCDGENWTVNYINQLMQSPLWAHTAILFNDG